MLGIVYLTQPLAVADQAKVSTALGWPRCARLTGTVIGSVPACGCTTGVGAGVHAACPYATRQQTDIVQCTGGFGLVVDPVMQASAPVLAAVPAVATAVVLSGVVVLAVAEVG